MNIKNAIIDMQWIELFPLKTGLDILRAQDQEREVSQDIADLIESAQNIVENLSDLIEREYQDKAMEKKGPDQ